MADGVGGRPKNALMKRHEQLEKWKESELAKVKADRSNAKIKVNFNSGCVFLASCSSGDQDEVKTLIDKGADINYANIDGLTALHQVKYKHPFCLQRYPEGCLKLILLGSVECIFLYCVPGRRFDPADITFYLGLIVHEVTL